MTNFKVYDNKRNSSWIIGLRNLALHCGVTPDEASCAFHKSITTLNGHRVINYGK